MSRPIAKCRKIRLAMRAIAVLLVAGGAWFGWNRIRAARWEKGLRLVVRHGGAATLDGIECIPGNLGRLRRHVRWVVPASGDQYYGVSLLLEPGPGATFDDLDNASILPFRRDGRWHDLFDDKGPRISFHYVFELDGIRRQFVTDDPWHQAHHNPYDDILWVWIGTERLVVGGRTGPWSDFPDGGEALDRFVADSTNLDEAFFAVSVEPDVTFERVKAVLHALCAACPSNDFCFFHTM